MTTTVCWLLFLLAVWADWIVLGCTEEPDRMADPEKVKPSRQEWGRGEYPQWIERRGHSRSDVWTLSCSSDEAAADFLVELSK